jgi:hypothetical protein
MIKKEKIKSFCEYLNGEYRERKNKMDIASGIRSTFIPLYQIKQNADRVYTCEAGNDYLEIWEKGRKTKIVNVVRKADIYHNVASINTVSDDLEDVGSRDDVMEIEPVKIKDKRLNLFADSFGINAKILPAGHFTTDDQSISFTDSGIEEVFKIRLGLIKNI